MDISYLFDGDEENKALMQRHDWSSACKKHHVAHMKAVFLL